MLAGEVEETHIDLFGELPSRHYKGRATIRVLLEGGIALRVYAAGATTK